NGEQAHLGSQGGLPRLVIGFTGSILSSPAMAGHLPAHPPGSSLETFGYRTNRRTGSDPSRDVLSLGQCECERRAATGGRNNPTALRQHKLNRHVVLAKSAPNLVQRLSRLPAAPHVDPLVRQKLHPSPKRHKHHL